MFDEENLLKLYRRDQCDSSCEKHYKMNVEKANTQKAKEARENIIKSGILY